MEDAVVAMTSLRNEAGSDVMKSPDEVGAIKRLHELGWGAKRIARELGISKNTVKKYLAAGGWVEYRGAGRPARLEPHRDWIGEEYRKHRGNAEVVRQELERQKGITASLRTVERAVAGQRKLFAAEAKATLRFETAPGEQAQVDFGTVHVGIGDETVQVHLFVMTLGFSRRLFVAPFLDESRNSWQSGMERGFVHFGGVTAEMLTDNAKALVKSHDAKTRRVEFSEPFLAFARYWGFVPRACAPYRARTKGKDENGVGYVKKNAIAGRSFASWSHLESHLAWWMREIADGRIHGTTGERPIDRFERERGALSPLAGRAPFVQVRELVRKVHTDLCVEVDTNHYSVPWRYIGEEVSVRIDGSTLMVHHGGQEIARHAVATGRRARIIDKAHLSGVSSLHLERPVRGELERPLSDYASAAGGL
ncbi:MAG TPA: IS21 family transposase [Verrucomicrobiota bacterium]|nr:IS21 family transposase [Verrucomicrobiota bacterium]